MQLAKPALDVGLYTNQLDPMLAFWQEHGYEMLSRSTKGLVDAVLIDEEGELTVPYLVGNYPTTYLMDEDFIVRYRGTSIADLLGAELNASLKAIAGPYRDMP